MASAMLTMSGAVGGESLGGLVERLLSAVLRREMGGRAFNGHEGRAVDGVDDGERSASAGGIGALGPRGRSAEDAGLAGVGVDDVGLDGSDECAEFAVGARVGEGGDFADEVGDFVGADG